MYWKRDGRYNLLRCGFSLIPIITDVKAWGVFLSPLRATLKFILLLLYEGDIFLICYKPVDVVSVNK